jgi:wobble nucleotide-excising tRNase
MIKHLYIKKAASFDDTGVRIDDLSEVNFIYGANASGKTTISKFLDNPDDDLFQNSSIAWGNNTPLTTLVFNSKFRDEHLRQEKIAGVFTLGKATQQEKDAIEEKKAERENFKEQGINDKKSQVKLQEDLDALAENFKEKAWKDLFKKYEGNFKEAFAGSMTKERFKEKLLSVIPDFENTVSQEELRTKAATIFGEPPTAMTPIQDINYLRLSEIENDNIWKKKIIGKADIQIAQLIQSLNMTDWISAGRQYIQEGSNVCPFCQQETISERFRLQLEEYFDDTFKRDAQTLNSMASEYERTAQNIISLLEGIGETQKNTPGSKMNIEKFLAAIKTLSSQYQTNHERITAKLKESSREFQLIRLKEQFETITSLIASANLEIKKHNKIVSNFQEEKAKTIQVIWNMIAIEYKDQIAEFKRLSAGKQRGINSLENKLKELRRKYKDADDWIKNAAKNVTSVQPTIDEINRLLHFYGFTGFEIVPAQEDVNSYQIKRHDGTIANETLSEGEVAFITFLYFLHLAKGGTTQDNVSDNRILVIDDPVSSLDSDVLFIVSSLIKEIIKTIKQGTGNIKQIILLTHNVYFHKEVSFVDGRTKMDRKTHYWILRKMEGVSRIEPCGIENPINNSYELLWNEINPERENKSISVPNTMRRIIEYYFKMLGKYGDNDLVNRFSTREEQHICRSLLYWTNDNSHGFPEDLFIQESPEAVNKYHEIFKLIFEHTRHIEHYNMMMGIAREDVDA